MCNAKKTTIEAVDASLPPEYPESLLKIISSVSRAQEKTIVVLDDDPTGTQTLSDVPVLTTWSSSVIEEEFIKRTPLFFILTNSRSLKSKQAAALAGEIGRNILSASTKSGRKFLAVSRSDSTLRGHYPMEVDHLGSALGLDHALKILVPAFFEGGRYTIDDIHYVREGNTLIPAANTPFAKDKAFGYEHSDLKAYIQEKSGGEVRANEVASFSLTELRTKSPETISERLKGLEKGTTCIVNARSYRDLEVFCLALIYSGREVLIRCAASILPVILGRSPGFLLGKKELTGREGSGILIVVGSYVPKTTAQLQPLLAMPGLGKLEVNVTVLLHQPDAQRNKLKVELSRRLSSGEDVLLYTSRQLVAGSPGDESLDIGNKVSTFLTQLVGGMAIRPRGIIAKGGITSSDTATKGLGVEKATVLGQIAPGVPVWRLGAEAKFPGLIYVVFPGNVGNENTLKEVYLKLKGTT